MEITVEQAQAVCAGRLPEFWDVLNGIADDTTWVDVVNNYNDIENNIDLGNIEGITPRPERPRPTSSRP